MVFAVLGYQEFEPLDGDIRHVRQVVVYARNLFFDARQQLVGLIFAEFKYALHLYFHQSHDVVAAQFAYEVGLEGCQSVVDMFHGNVHILGVLKLLVFVNALFDEYFFKRREEKLLQQFVFPYLQFQPKQPHRAVNVMAQHLAYGEETRLIVFDNTAVGRNVNLAVAKCVECINGLVRRNARGEVHLYLYFGRRIVVYALGLYLSLLHRFKNRVDKRGGVLAERYLADNKCLAVQFLNLGAHLDRTAPLSVVISAGINRTARGEVGI